jgi:curved DNA-binding protein
MIGFFGMWSFALGRYSRSGLGLTSLNRPLSIVASERQAMSAAKLTVDQARAILGLAPDASPHAVIGAFRAAAKAAHPDLPGGDAAQFRDILAAYRLLQSLPRPPAAIGPIEALPAEPHVEIGPLTALFGGEAEAVLADGRSLRIRIPSGARHGETIEAGPARVKLRIAAEPDVQVRGSDLWVTAEVSPGVLDKGGRASVATPLGDKVLWISHKLAERGLVRLEGQGLPARAGHPQGSLFIRLVPDTGAPESSARIQLRKFAAAWAA